MSAAGSRRVALLLATALLAGSALWWRWGAAVFVSGLGSGLC